MAIEVIVYENSSRTIKAKDPTSKWSKVVQSIYVRSGDKPVPVEIVIDIPDGNQPFKAGKYSLDLNQVGIYPDHKNFNAPALSTTRLPMFLKSQAS